MKTTVKMDQAGRIALPKRVRDDLNVSAGDELALEWEGERVTLRPVRAGMRLQREQGVWVFSGSGKMTAEASENALRDVRTVRDKGLRESREE